MTLAASFVPMAITQHERDGIYYFLTMGVSIRPMPWVEILFNDEASRYRRMEMAIAIDSGNATMATVRPAMASARNWGSP